MGATTKAHKAGSAFELTTPLARRLLDVCLYPYASPEEMATLKGERDAESLRQEIVSLAQNGLLQFVPHVTSLRENRPVRRYFISRSGLEALIERTGMDIKEISEHIYCTNGIRWMLIRRMDIIALTYTIAKHIIKSRGDAASPVEVHFPRRGPIDAFINTSDAVVAGVMRLGASLPRRNALKRFWAINKHRISPSLLFITTPSQIERDSLVEWLGGADRTLWVVASEEDVLENDADFPCWMLPPDNVRPVSATRIASFVEPSESYSVLKETPLKKQALPRNKRWPAVSGYKRAVVDTLHYWPLLTTSEIAGLLNISRVAVWKLIAALKEENIVVVPQGVRGKNRYALTNDGIRWLSYRDRTPVGGNVRKWGMTDSGIPQGTQIRKLIKEQEHTIGINKLAVKIVEETNHAARVVSQVHSTITYPTKAGGHRSIYPDIVVSLPTENGRETFLIEYELRARTVAMFLKKTETCLEYFSYLQERNRSASSRRVPSNNSTPDNTLPFLLFVVKDSGTSVRFSETIRQARAKRNIPAGHIFIVSEDTIVNNGNRVVREIWRAPEDRYLRRVNPFSAESREKLASC